MSLRAQWIVVPVAALGIASTGQATTQCTARSGQGTTALVELYTSEGCDSCPPADRWLSSLAGQGFSRQQVVPIALHVDYWDYLGWKDPYAKARFSARQRKLAQVQRARVVYTPQVMLQGRDFRGWQGAEFAEAVERINRQAAAATIELQIAHVDGAFKVGVQASLREPAATSGAQLFLAAYENKLQSQVAGGENRGKTLSHDYVVLEWVGPLDFGADGRLQSLQSLPLLPKAVAAHSGVAAFVQDRRTGGVLQALMRPAC